MHITLEELKEELKGEFLPMPVINKDHIVRSVKEAVRKYNIYKGFMDGVEKSFSKVIDLEEDQREPRYIIEVLPSLNDTNLSSLEAGQRIKLQNMLDFVGLTGKGDIDATNQLTILIQKRDQFETIKSFFGFQPKFELEKNKLYLEHFDQNMDSVYVIARWKIKSELYSDSSNWSDVNIFDEYGYDWIRDYSQAALEERQGRVIQKASVADLDVDGSDLRKHGRQEQDDLLEEIKSKRYISF